MNMQAANLPSPSLTDRLYDLPYLVMVELAEKLSPTGTVGFAPLVRYKVGTPGETPNPHNPDRRRIVHCFGDWLIATYGEAKVAAFLPQFEGRRKRQQSGATVVKPTTAKPTPAVPYTQPTPTAKPVPKRPVPLSPTPASQYAEGSMERIVEAIAHKVMEDAGFTPNGGAILDGAAVIDTMLPVIEAAIERAKIKQVHLTVVRTSENGETHSVNLGRVHMMFERLLSRCRLVGKDGNRYNVWLTGPAGSGKTTAAMQVAKALGLDFYHTGALDTEYKLLGFTDAQGRVVNTDFRKAWEFGGIFLFDEVDASLPGALMALNAALANGHCAFPDGNIERHKDTIIIAAANTWGSGATFEYVGRNKLDSASLDRFVKLAWNYDEAMERDTSGNLEWAMKVQAWRKAVATKGIKHIISPRATYVGATMLAAGIPEGEVIEELVAAGMTDSQRAAMGFPLAA